MPMIGEIEASSVLTLVALVITSVSAFGAAWLSYLSGRDKLKYDSEMKSFREKLRECESERREDRERFGVLADRADKAEKQASRLEGEMAGASRELVALRDEVTELRDRLYGSSRGGVL